MKNLNFVKDILPHLIAVVLFALITVIYFNPIFFQNQSINQYDIQQWYGGAHELEEFREATGEEGLWTNSMFSGMPGYLINIDWSNGIVEGLQKVFTLFMPHPVKYIYAAFLSFYIMLLSFKAKPYAAMVVAIGFGLSSFLIIGLSAGHNARIGAIAFMPLVMAGIHLIFQKKWWIGFALTAAGLALELRVNHLQITYYLFLIVVIYGIVMLYSAYKAGEIKSFFQSTGIAVVAALVAVGTFFGEFWGTYEYSKYSMRGKSELTSTTDRGENTDGLEKSYAFNYSNGIFEPFTLMIPNILGGASSNYFAMDRDSESFKSIQRNADQQTANQLLRFTSSYWGKQPLSAPYYAGAVICFLFVLGIILVNRKIKIWLLIVFVLGIILSWGSNFSSFNYVIFDYLPGYNKFRSVTFTLVMALFSMGLLGGLGLSALFEKSSKNKLKSLVIAWGATAGLSLILIVIAGMFSYKGQYDDQLPAWFINALKEDRMALLRADAFRSFIFITLAAGILYAYLKNRINAVVAAAAIFILSLVDLWSVDKRYLNDDNFERNALRNYFVETEADKTISEDNSIHYRVLNLISPWNEAKTSYFHSSLGGYHGAKMRRYQDLVDHCLQNEIQQLIGNLQSGNMGMEEYGVINMLNAKYLKAGDNAQMVLPNQSALGNGWFVDEVVRVNSPDEELNAVCELDTRNNAVVDASKFNPPAETNGNGTVNLTSYAPNKLVYEVNSENGGLAVFSEIYYPKGWIARIDGEETPIMRANYVLRALEIPAGTHQVEFEFRPAPYYVGNKITLVFNIILLLVILGTAAKVFIPDNKLSEIVTEKE